MVSVPYSAAMNPRPAFSVEVWLNPNVENAAGTLTCALRFRAIRFPRSGWLIYQSDTGWNFRMSEPEWHRHFRKHHGWTGSGGRHLAPCRGRL